MSITYGVSLTLQSENTKENIYTIIKKGEEIGFAYFDLYNKHILEIQDVVKIIFYNWELNIDDELPIVSVKYQDTFFFLQASSNDSNKLLEVSIGYFAPSWKNEFGYDAKIDFARYIRLLLKLCKDFTIEHLETSTI